MEDLEAIDAKLDDLRRQLLTVNSELDANKWIAEYDRLMKKRQIIKESYDGFRT